MGGHTVEFKARCKDMERVRAVLRVMGAEFRGEDHQVDTYFLVPRGRLKLREGNIENALIFYERENISGPKKCDYLLTPVVPGSNLRSLLGKAFGILTVVDKHREIYYAGNVKIHLDSVSGLGCFVEAEAGDSDGSVGESELLAQCREFLVRFGVEADDLVDVSYSDLLRSTGETRNE